LLRIILLPPKADLKAPSEIKSTVFSVAKPRGRRGHFTGPASKKGAAFPYVQKNHLRI